MNSENADNISISNETTYKNIMDRFWHCHNFMQNVVVTKLYCSLTPLCTVNVKCLGFNV